jgi:hypothetical protein
MLPALSVAVGNATALRINARLPADTVTAKGTPGRGRVPSPMSTVAVPLKVALPSAATDPLPTSPSTVMFCGVPRGEVPKSTAWNWPFAEPPWAMKSPCRGASLSPGPLKVAHSMMGSRELRDSPSLLVAPAYC